MAGLLGQRDELLRLVEAAFPQTRIVVQGNRISADGPDAERVARLFEDLVLVLESVRASTRRTSARTIDMVREDLRPSDVLNAEVVRAAKGARSGPTRPGRSATPTPSPPTRSPSGSDPPGRASRTWPSRRPSRRSRPGR